MIDLERRFESLDRLDAPDLWGEIEYQTELRPDRLPTPRLRFAHLVAPRGVLVALGAAVVILAVVGLTTWLFVSSGSNSPPVINQDTTPTSLTSTVPETTLPPTTVPATTVPAADATPDLEALGWQNVSSDTNVLGSDTFGAQWDQIISGPDGYLAWGYTWNREDVERLCDENGFSCGGDAVSDLFQGAAWTSPDGTTWAKHDAPELLEIYVGNPFVDGSITTGGPGYVGAGTIDDSMEGFVLTSTDGTTWDATRLEMGPQEGLVVSDIAAGPSGWVAVGGFMDGTTFEVRSAAWVSSDGQNWQRNELYRDPNLFDFLDEVVTAGPGFVAISGSGQTWRSSDGVTWIRGIELDGLSSGLGLLELDGGLVVVGDGGVVWTSPDAESWTLVHQEDFGLDTDVGSLWAAGGDGLRVFAFDGSQLFMSADGINWTMLTVPPHTRTVGPFGNDGIIAGVHSVWPPMTPDLSGVEVWIWTPPG